MTDKQEHNRQLLHLRNLLSQQGDYWLGGCTSLPERKREQAELEARAGMTTAEAFRRL